MIDFVVELSKTMREVERNAVAKIVSDQVGEAFKPEIVPCENRGSFYQYSIDTTGISVAGVLGFESNVDEDDSYGASWAFTVDGEYCAIWFRLPGGTARAYGSLEKLKLLFGDRVS